MPLPCTISKWTIKPEHVNHLSDIILKSETEQAGAIVFDDENMISSNIILNSSGDKDSVHINLSDNHIISFHTLPISAYIQAQCIYGHIHRAMTFVNSYVYRHQLL